MWSRNEREGIRPRRESIRQARPATVGVEALREGVAAALLLVLERYESGGDHVEDVRVDLTGGKERGAALAGVSGRIRFKFGVGGNRLLVRGGIFAGENP